MTTGSNKDRMWKVAIGSGVSGLSGRCAGLGAYFV